MKVGLKPGYQSREGWITDVSKVSNNVFQLPIISPGFHTFQGVSERWTWVLTVLFCMLYTAKYLLIQIWIVGPHTSKYLRTEISCVHRTEQTFLLPTTVANGLPQWPTVIYLSAFIFLIKIKNTMFTRNYKTFECFTGGERDWFRYNSTDTAFWIESLFSRHVWCQLLPSSVTAATERHGTDPESLVRDTPSLSGRVQDAEKPIQSRRCITRKHTGEQKPTIQYISTVFSVYKYIF